MKDYVNINRNAWNIKTDVHLESDFYENKEFLQGKSSLNDIELDLLGDIKGKKILHLQCHFGQDSMSLARMGAKVVAVDLSDNAIEKAKMINNQLGLDVEFICSNIYDLPDYLDQQFDIVFTSYGVIGWLPDLDKWATIISKYLKKGGQFIFVEFHPLIWMFDDNAKQIIYSYFKTDAIEETIKGTYAEKTANVEYQTVTWNHSLSEVLQSLIKHEIQIKSFNEHDYSVYNCFNSTIEVEKGKFRIKHLGDKIPMMFSLLGEKV